MLSILVVPALLAVVDPQLLDDLESADKTTRTNAALNLAHYADDPEVVPVLGKLLSHPERDMRSAAIGGIGRFKEAAAPYQRANLTSRSSSACSRIAAPTSVESPSARSTRSTPRKRCRS